MRPPGRHRERVYIRIRIQQTRTKTLFLLRADGKKLLLGRPLISQQKSCPRWYEIKHARWIRKLTPDIWKWSKGANMLLSINYSSSLTTNMLINTNANGMPLIALMWERADWFASFLSSIAIQLHMQISRGILIFFPSPFFKTVWLKYPLSI